MTIRAKIGGQVGVNGEWYDGGQFLPSHENTIKGSSTNHCASTSRKVEIAPYRWEYAPEGKKSIWSIVSGVCEFTKTGYSKEYGATGTLKVAEYFNWQAAGWTLEGMERVRKLVDQWNSGERWT